MRRLILQWSAKGWYFDYNFTGSLTVTETILMSSYGLSVFGCVLVLEILTTVSMPLTTRPKTVCLLSSHDVGTTVMKNWLPLVLGPAFAMLMVYGRSCFNLGWNSSSNSSPHRDSPKRIKHVPILKIVKIFFLYMHKTWIKCGCLANVFDYLTLNQYCHKIYLTEKSPKVSNI